MLILLFEVGLESTVGQMLRVGLSSLLVASVGLVLPFALGWGASTLAMPEASGYVHAFVGATLCATSVGITARVLQDLDRAQTPEARIILGAAVVDDVMGLVILAVASGAMVAADGGGRMSALSVVNLVARALGFLALSLAAGVLLSRKLFSLASRLQARGVLLAIGLSLCFLLSWAAAGMGLAPIIGAFAAGLILEAVHYRDFVDRGEHPLEDLVHPISSFLVPVFFVMMGMRTDLRAFADPSVVGLTAAITVAAILGKQACGLAVTTPGVDRLTVGIGMIPRGEVGLIFANIGFGLTVKGERVITPQTFSALVAMVILTTLLTPPALKWSLGRARRRAAA